MEEHPKDGDLEMEGDADGNAGKGSGGMLMALTEQLKELTDVITESLIEVINDVSETLSAYDDVQIAKTAAKETIAEGLHDLIVNTNILEIFNEEDINVSHKDLIRGIV